MLVKGVSLKNKSKRCLGYSVPCLYTRFLLPCAKLGSVSWEMVARSFYLTYSSVKT